MQNSKFYENAISDSQMFGFWYWKFQKMNFLEKPAMKFTILRNFQKKNVQYYIRGLGAGYA